MIIIEPQMSKKLNQILDEYLLCDFIPEVRQLIEEIVFDRHYVVPVWFYDYINPDILFTIINRYIDEIYDREDFTVMMDGLETKRVSECFYEFIDKYYELAKGANHATFISSMIQYKRLEWCYFLNVKEVYRVVESSISRVSPDEIMSLITKYLERNPKKEVPLSYIRLFFRCFLTPMELRNLSCICAEPGYTTNFSKTFMKAEKAIKYLLAYMNNHEICDQPYRILNPLWKKYKNLFSKKAIVGRLIYSLSIETIWKYVSFMPVDADLFTFYKSLRDYSSYMYNAPLLPDNYGEIASKLVAKYEYIKKKNPGSRKLHIGPVQVSSDLVISELKDYILKCVDKNIHNVNHIFWNIKFDKAPIKKSIEASFAKNPRLRNYNKFYACTGHIVKKKEAEVYLSSGGDLFSILKCNIGKPGSLTPLNWVELILQYATEKDKVEFLMTKSNLLGLKSGTLPLEFVIQEVVRPKTVVYQSMYSNFRQCVFNNPELIDEIELRVENGIDIIHKLTTLPAVDMAELIANYPKLAIRDNTYIRSYYDVDKILSTKYILEYIPWKFIDMERLRYHIEQYGYLRPLVQIDKPEDGIVQATSKMALIISTLSTGTIVQIMNYSDGKGSGYILDYTDPTYVSTLIEARLSYLKDMKEDPEEEIE